ncbi:MAG: 16S rRNA (cytidine(1402)-2'-O)-methyltransferase [Waddliaceae bacterium]|nr:16S rRNA (cytidine(1402)-2'-O)-methyltransferase [Waddliaceae bacterium]
MLYLVATPIGNLQDFSFRAVEVLRNCEYVLCEDTRHSGILLKHYEISVPTRSFHKFNEAAREKELIEDLLSGKDIALISDAGTPGICDPGERLVALCREKSIEVQSIPGACAFLQALTSSGLNCSSFQFLGFVPKKKAERRKFLFRALFYDGSTVSYESPHRIKDTLSDLAALSPNTRVAISRELTKKFEEQQLASAEDLAKNWEEREPRGEFVLMIEGNPQNLWNDVSPQEQIAEYEKLLDISHKDAIRLVADLRGLSRRELYKEGL